MMADNNSPKRPDFVNSSPLSENSMMIRPKFLDVSNISTSGGSSAKSPVGTKISQGAKQMTKKRPTILASKNNGPIRNARPKPGKHSQKMNLENKENRPIKDEERPVNNELLKQFLTSSPTCSTISEGTASQIAKVIRTGALDQVLFSSSGMSSSSCTLSSSFVSMARELGFEMSLLNLSTNKPASLDRPRSIPVTTPLPEKSVAVVNAEELQDSDVYDCHLKTRSNTDDVERYRRMQCEKIIDELQDKLLETQQDLAVAVAQGNKKEKRLREMNQLLEKVGESWQNLESNSKRLYVENEAHKLEASKLAQASSLLEENIARLIGENSTLQRRVDQAKERHQVEIAECQGELIHLRKQLNEDRAKYWEELGDAQRELASARQGLQESEKSRLDKESELKRNLLDVQSELSLTNCKLKEAELECQSLQRRAESLVREESATRRRLEVADGVKESMEMELKRCGANCAIWEVEHQAILKKNESELRAELDRQVRALKESHLAEFARATADHKDREEASLREHGREVEFLRQEVKRLTQSLNLALSESESLKTEASKLRIGRSQILSRLQKYLQTQWFDAVQLLYDSPDSQQASLLTKENFGMFGYDSPPFGPETSSKNPLGDFNVDELDRLLASSKDKGFDVEMDQESRVAAIHSERNAVSDEEIKNWLERNDAFCTGKSHQVQKSSQVFSARRDVADVIVPNTQRDSTDRTIAVDALRARQEISPTSERLFIQPMRDLSDNSNPGRGNGSSDLGSLVPERDSPSSNTSSKNTTPSPLQHYIHLLLKQPPSQQVHRVETIDLSESQTNDKAENRSPKKTAGKSDKSPPWK